MPFDIAYSDPLLILAEGAKPTAPTRFILLRDGDIGWLGLDATLTPAGAKMVLAHFKHEGHDIPIDYHHSSVVVEDAQQGKAPAAGWIKALEYVEGEGLYAAVIEWSATATAEIEAQKFKYLSPVVRVNRETGQVGYLHSVALTNRPRTKDQRELLAAAMRLDEEFNMDPKTKKQKRGKGRTLLVKADAAIEAAQLDEEASAKLAELIVALQDKGSEITDESPLIDVIQAALDAVAGGGGEEDDEAAKAAAAKAEAKTKEDADKAAADAAANADNNGDAELKLKAAAYDAMGARLASLEADRKVSRVDALIEDQVKAGKLLPDDENLMKAARTMAEADETRFVTLFGAMPTLCEPGQLVTAAGDNGKAGNKRERLIAGAAREWKDNPRARPGIECASWVNTDLRKAGLDLLAADEVKAL